MGFAVALEELGDGGSGAGFEVGVEVEEGPVEAGGEEAADGGLARDADFGERPIARRFIDDDRFDISPALVAHTKQGRAQ